MVLKDIDRLMGIRRLIDEVVDLTGNVGKKVRRVLETYFPAGTFDLLLQADLELTLFQFACYLSCLMEGCELANDDGVYRQRHFHFEIESVDPLARSYRLRIAPQRIPESMLERQALLRDFAAMLERMIAFAVDTVSNESVMPQMLEDFYFFKLYGEDAEADTPESRKVLRDRFEALLQKNYEGIVNLPVALVDLAAILDPEISAALRDAIEQQPLSQAA